MGEPGLIYTKAIDDSWVLGWQRNQEVLYSKSGHGKQDIAALPEQKATVVPGYHSPEGQGFNTEMASLTCHCPCQSKWLTRMGRDIQRENRGGEMLRGEREDPHKPLTPLFSIFGFSFVFFLLFFYHHFAYIYIYVSFCILNINPKIAPKKKKTPFSLETKNSDIYSHHLQFNPLNI